MQSVATTQNAIRLRAKPVVLSIEAFGLADMTIEKISASRKEPFTCFPRALSPQLLRHSDEQTIVSLVALSEAMRGVAATSDYGDWAIISSARNLGRSAFAGVMNKYREEGPWGVSVQVIPNCTAHSVAGTISLAVASHGPCIGVGGHPGCEVQALYSTASILCQSKWSGGWVLFSGWSPELTLNTRGLPVSASTCFAVALAVREQPSANSIGQIRLEAPCNDTSRRTANETRDRKISLDLIEFLVRAADVGGVWSSRPTNSIGVEINILPGWHERLKLRLNDEFASCNQLCRNDSVS